MFCLQQAFHEAGIEIHLPPFINRSDLPIICKRAGGHLLGYYASREECENQDRLLEYFREVARISPDDSVIVIYTTKDVIGHAEYFRHMENVPESKKRGMIIRL